MSIAVQDHISNGVTSGTTVTTTAASQFNPTTGNWIIVQCAVTPTNANLSFAQTAGTATLGSFSTPVVVRLGNVNMAVTTVYCSSGGTCQITCTSDQTITNGSINAVAFSGSGGGFGQDITGSGSTGTDITLSLTTVYSNSWLVMCATAFQAAFLTAGTNTVRDASDAVVTALSTATGSNHSPLTVGTTLDLHFTQTNNSDYGAVMFELIGDALAAGAASIASTATAFVASNLVATEATIAAAATATVTSNLVSAEGTIGARAMVLGVNPPPPLPQPEIGPPIPGSPWFDIFPFLDDLGYSFTPPFTPPPTPGAGFFPLVPRYLPWAIDRDRQSRLQKITEQVSQIINSLYGRGELKRLGIVEWTLGYPSAAAAYWNGNPPVTIDEALNRIAIAIKQLNGTGP